jgi:hypothetical protein
MQTHALVLSMTFALSAAGCLSGASTRPDRLYPAPPQPLGREQVSTLGGPVQFVDDKEVLFGGYFELLPGCHIIGTPEKVLWPVGKARVAIMGRLTFALPMRAGHQYSIEVRSGVETAPRWQFTTQVYERDLRGTKTREFEHVTSPKEIEACKEEAAGSLPLPQ